MAIKITQVTQKAMKLLVELIATLGIAMPSLFASFQIDFVVFRADKSRSKDPNPS